jgi:uncharacterized protein (DUF952 family)
MSGDPITEAGGHVTRHLIRADEWAAWQRDPDPAATYVPAGYEADGFVHCTDGDDALLATGDRHYRDVPGAFVALDVDLARVGAPWRYDDPAGVYPHVYGPLRRDAVRRVRPVRRTANGRFVGYDDPVDPGAPRGRPGL